MERYLITGGCGFIGSHLCDRLVARGASLRILDDLSTGKRENLPAGVELIIGSVTDSDLVHRTLSGMDGCFHLAAIASVQRSIEDWQETNAINLAGTIAVFDAARRLGRPAVVYASSAAIYGDNPALPLTETAIPHPLSAYGVDKLGCELHGRIASAVHGVPTTGFRFFNVYGPRQDPASPYSGVISVFVEKLLQGAPLTLFGDGLQSRDFVFVSDVIDHLLAAMAQPAPEARVFNVCSGHATTLIELIAVLGRLIAHHPTITFLPERSGDIRSSLGSPVRCQRGLGVATKTSLMEGLKVTIAALKRLPRGS